MNRIEGRDKVTGRAAYAYEYPVENVAYAHPVPSRVARGRIRAIDAAAVLATPGVLAVLSSDEPTFTAIAYDTTGSTSALGQTLHLAASAGNEIVSLAPQPSRSDAVWAYVFTAVFAAGGIYCGAQEKKLHDDLQNDIAKGMPPPDSNDPRILRGKIYAIGADVGFGLAAITGLTAIYYTFRNKGSPSTGTIDQRALALHPEIGSNYAGVGMEVSW